MFIAPNMSGKSIGKRERLKYKLLQLEVYRKNGKKLTGIPIECSKRNISIARKHLKK